MILPCPRTLSSSPRRRRPASGRADRRARQEAPTGSVVQREHPADPVDGVDGQIGMLPARVESGVHEERHAADLAHQHVAVAEDVIAALDTASGPSRRNTRPTGERSGRSDTCLDLVDERERGLGRGDDHFAGVCHCCASRVALHGDGPAPVGGRAGFIYHALLQKKPSASGL